MLDAGTYGAPSWVDLSTPDLEAATTFYRELLGWTLTQQRTPFGDHVIGAAGGLEVGGIMQAVREQQGTPPMWTVFFYVADVENVVEKVRHAEGRVLEPAFDLPDGRVAVVADPTGGMFGVISHRQPEGTWLSTMPGAVCWVELLTRDTAAAEPFYATVFGWKADTRDYPGTRYTTFALGDDVVAGMMAMPDEVPAEAPAHWSVSFAVGDCEAAERRAVELGGQVLRPTTAMDDGRFAVLADPAGATFQVMDHPR